MCLDRNGDRVLDKFELMEYFQPFVNCMTPPQAEALRPLLLQKATDQIYKEMDWDLSDSISSDEFLMWARQGNNVVDRLATIIEQEVHIMWLHQRDNETMMGYSGYDQPLSPGRGGSVHGAPMQSGFNSPMRSGFGGP